eukprot:CAMPEP_0116007808 /NCGR_PEP_ID=MMETSP0321-20121206/2506_1 /TAXON_ID=163516 /ORGANISM="Leptocylindrus danicus var. danicus, Strain B650" /LENGTH=240 /DNA_ID=CAMNT_0003476547 /DNA_START=26 /DNA_END=748 /DNA_ORIENTATION=+
MSVQGAIPEEGKILQERCCKEYGWSEEQSQRAVDAYAHFLNLKANMNDWEATILSPSTIINQVWRLHILDTRAYMKFCQEYAGRFIHYGVSGRDATVNVKEKRIETTKIAVMAKLGSEALNRAEWSFDEENDDDLSISEDSNLFLFERQLRRENDEERTFVVSVYGFGMQVHCRIRPTTRCERMMHAFAEHTRLDVGMLIFFYKNLQVLPHELPRDLGLSEGDMIRCNVTPSFYGRLPAD